MLRLNPNAKINLGLLIKGRRPDGYHLLETVLLPIDSLRDVLEMAESQLPDVTIELSGLTVDCDPKDNLCARAYHMLAEAEGGLPGVYIRLHKNIPSGAGLGGGSSNAAHTLLGLNTLFDLGYTLDELAGMAARLGADVPFFLYNRPLLASGIGTELEELKLPLPYRVELVTPAIHSSTAEAYQSLDYSQCDPDRSLLEILQSPVAEWRHRLVNDLEGPVFRKYPELAQIKAELYARGAVYASMSGSGSAVYGLFERH